MFGDNIPVINNAQYGNNHDRELCKLQQSVWDITLKLIVLEYNKRLMKKLFSWWDSKNAFRKELNNTIGVVLGSLCVSVCV